MAPTPSSNRSRGRPSGRNVTPFSSARRASNRPSTASNPVNNSRDDTNRVTPGTSGLRRRIRSQTPSCLLPRRQRQRPNPVVEVAQVNDDTTSRTSRSSGVASTPSPLRRGSSIRYTARCPVQGAGLQTNLYNPQSTQDDSLFDSTVTSSPIQLSATPLVGPTSPDLSVGLPPENAATDDIGLTPPATTADDTPPLPRHCYCNTACSACYAHDAACSDHPGLYCSGPCQRWFHVSCTGWALLQGTDDPSQAVLVPPFDPNCRIELNSQTQSQTSVNEDWYCIKCWEAHKRNLKATATENDQPRPVTQLKWHELNHNSPNDVREMGYRFGIIMPPPCVEDRNELRKFKKKVSI